MEPLGAGVAVATGVVEPLAPGMIKVCPTKILKFVNLFVVAMASTVVLNLSDRR